MDLDINSAKNFFLADLEANLKIKFKITEMNLYLPEMCLQNDLYLEIRKQQADHPLSYYFKRVEYENVTINANSKAQYFGHLNVGKYNASKLLVGVQLSDAWTGDFKLDPNQFSHKFDNLIIENIRCTLGQTSLDGYENAGIDKPSLITDYLRFYNFLNLYNEKGTCNVSFQKFKNSMYLLPFDLSTSLSESTLLRPVTRKGNLELMVKFNKPVDKDLLLVTIFFIPTKVDVHFE